MLPVIAFAGIVGFLLGFEGALAPDPAAEFEDNRPRDHVEDDLHAFPSGMTALDRAGIPSVVAKAWMAKQANFRFEAHDLEIIHHAVSRWSIDNSYGVGHKETVFAARQAFFLYRDGMEENELLNMLHRMLSIRH